MEAVAACLKNLMGLALVHFKKYWLLRNLQYKIFVQLWNLPIPFDKLPCLLSSPVITRKKSHFSLELCKYPEVVQPLKSVQRPLLHTEKYLVLTVKQPQNILTGILFEYLIQIDTALIWFREIEKNLMHKLLYGPSMMSQVKTLLKDPA